VRVYLDSAPLIYLIEDVDPFAAALEARLAAPDMFQVCSDLTRMECRVKPIRDEEDALLFAFDDYFAEVITEVIPLSRGVMDQATLLRARYGFKTPDAIHLAASIVGDCDLFLTNDHRLDRCTEIAVEAI
jgi:predicted nucleic acid-binding protein